MAVVSVFVLCWTILLIWFGMIVLLHLIILCLVNQLNILVTLSLSFYHVLPFSQGQSWQDKVERIREKLKEEGCSGLVCTALDENACKPVVSIQSNHDI